MNGFHLKIAIMGLIITFISSTSFSQSQFPNIDPKWDSYYGNYPSGIRENHQAIDFIKVINTLQFIPQSGVLKGNTNLFEKALLKLDQDAMNQMMMDGDYYSRTYKHDDYFYLYNLSYKNISKESWDKYCPYLIPLMSLDKTISLHK